MHLDELVDILVQPQQDQEVKIEVDGKLFDLIVVPKHPSKCFVLRGVDLEPF